MKVLHTIYSMDPKMGGTVEALLQLILESRNYNQVHEVLCLDSVQKIEQFNHPVSIHGVGPTKRFYGDTPKIDQWLEDNLKNYDLAIIHGCWQYHGLATFRACKKQGLPYLQYTHGMLDPWFKKQYPLKHLKKWLYWPWAEYRILKNAKSVIFTCEEERDLAPKSFWLYKVNPRVIPLGIRKPDFDLQDCKEKWFEKYESLKTQDYILFLSRIHEKKGVDDLIEAVCKLNKSQKINEKTSPFVLVIAGPCENPEYLQSLKKRTSSIYFEGPISDIIWTGMIAGKMKWGSIAGASAFILPSHQENFGMVIPESLACSTPVLISNKVNIWKEIQLSNSGIIENDGVSGAYNLLAKWVMMTDEKKLRFRSNAASAFDKYFNILNNASHLFSLIESIKKDDSNKT